MDTKDILLGVMGFSLSFYGGTRQNLLFVVSGILLIILDIYLNLREQEEDVRIIKAQINTQNELKRMRREIDEIKSNKREKRGN